MNLTVNKPTKAEIRGRAFELYLERGAQPGHELDDWLQAEFELTHRPFHILHLQPIRPLGNRSRRRRRQLRFSPH